MASARIKVNVWDWPGDCGCKGCIVDVVGDTRSGDSGYQYGDNVYLYRDGLYQSGGRGYSKVSV